MPAPDFALLARCERIEAAAFASVVAAAPPGFAATIHLASARISGALAIASGTIDKRMCNHVFGLGVESPATDDDVRAVEAHCRGAGAKRCTVAAAPGPHADALEAALRANGFAPAGVTLRLACRMSRPGASIAPATLAARELAPEQAHAFATVLVEVFAFPAEFSPWFARIVGRPGWRVFGAFEGERMVGCGATFSEGDVGWLGLGATLAPWRGRGAQSATIAARVAAARVDGLTLLAVETGPDTPGKPNASTRNLRRLGFEQLYERPTWVKVLREG